MSSTTDQKLQSDLPFDPDALRRKYSEERDKRVRVDGNEQYQDVVGDFAHYLNDPYVEPLVREPLYDDVEVVIIGGGFGGLLTGARLREAGIQDLRVIEKGGDFGGTWYWNRYPGAACDVESYIYLPLLEELGYIPKEKYTHAPEILKHSRAIGEHFDLYRNACFQTEVTEVRWDDDAQRWIISTNRDDRMRARFVCMANGPLHRPKLPGIAGVETYRGHSFHTSRWDYDYTGGTSDGGLSGLAGKRIGIIGTGATAVQCVPHIGAAAGELFVFQRTPSSIDVRNNRDTDPAWAKSLEPGWQKRRMENFNNLVSGIPESEDLVGDGWTDIIGKLLVMVRNNANADFSPEGLAQTMELADFEKMEQIRSRVDQIVHDNSTAEALKPYYRQFCKRPCFHDEYLQTFTRPNVTLVDTAGQGVDRITERGVVANGVEYELDCIIYATGFEVGTEYSRRAGYEIIGRDGITLTEKWADGASTFHGFHTRGFPNCFIISNLQSGFTVNFPHMLSEQATHLGYILSHAEKNGITRIETTKKAEDEWVQKIISLSQMNVKFLESCTPGYYNNEGKPSDRAIQNGSFGGGSVAFIQLLENWRADKSFAGLELTK
ncbi:MAG: NAD(P)/FAD-dependent oxidoreductase [Ilumatobacteraceae bacterium]|nr:NAD(P)/FAD-dependent oxidoreductase [Ilumatobacteraceae bacterium]